MGRFAARPVEPVERFRPRALAEAFERRARPLGIAELDQLGLGMVERLGHRRDASAAARGDRSCRWSPVSSGAHVRAGPGGGGARRRRAPRDRGGARRSRAPRSHRHGTPRRGRPGRSRTGPPGGRGRRARVAAPACRREPRAGERAEGRARARSPARDERAGGDRGRSRTTASRAFAFAGEVSLKGELLTTPGILTVAIAAARAGLDGIVVPAANAVEAAQVEGLRVVGAETLSDAVGFLRGTWSPPEVVTPADDAPAAATVDLAEVRGQTQARRALEVAAAGGHNLLMVGSPGAGKTMLARRLPTILPELSREESLEATQLHSVAGLLGASRGLLRARPFRAPHHSVSTVGLLGGGSTHRATGRGQPRAPRRAVPRRAHRVPPRRRRGIAAAARGRACRHHARRRVGGVPRAVHPRGRGQPVSVRLRRRRAQAVRLPTRSGPAVPEQAVGAAARSDRHPAAHPAADQGGAARLLAGGGVRGGREPGSRRRATGSAGDGPRWVCRATRICPGRSRAGRCSLSPGAEALLTKAVEMLALTGRGLRPRHQGRPDGRRPRRLGRASRPITWPRRSRTGAASAPRSSRVPDEPQPPRAARLAARVRRRRRASGRDPDALGAARPAPAHRARGGVGAGLGTGCVESVRRGRLGSDGRSRVAPADRPRRDRRARRGGRREVRHAGGSRVRRSAARPPGSAGVPLPAREAARRLARARRDRRLEEVLEPRTGRRAGPGASARRVRARRRLRRGARDRRGGTSRRAPGRRAARSRCSAPASTSPTRRAAEISSDGSPRPARS